MKKFPLVLALSCIAALPARAETLRWDVVGEGKETLARAYHAEAGEVLEGEDLPVLFFGCRADGGLELWVHIDKELVDGQVMDADGMREPLGPTATVTLGSVRFEFPDAVVTPEELYGGNELMLQIARQAPFLDAASAAQTLDVAVAGFALSVPLQGAEAPLAALASACG